MTTEEALLHADVGQQLVDAEVAETLAAEVRRLRGFTPAKVREKWITLSDMAQDSSQPAYDLQWASRQFVAWLDEQEGKR